MQSIHPLFRAPHPGAIGRRWGVWFVLLLVLGLAQSPLTSQGADSKKGQSGAQSSSIPGGSLDAHERAGGHLLERHVGKTADQLRQRLANDTRISAASSFTDRKTAEAAVAACISMNQKKIDAWMKGDEDRLVITRRGNTPVGISVTRGASKEREASSTRLVLVRDKRLPTGWKILTGYPEL